jgi:Lon protease-like protein
MSINKPYKSADELPDIIPVFPLPGVMLLPRAQLPLNIFEPRYMAMIDDALKSHRLIGMIQSALDENPNARNPALEKVGCLGRITQIAETGDGRYMLNLTGVARFRIAEELTVMTPYRQLRADYAPFTSDFTPRAGEDDVDREAVLDALRRFAEDRQLKIDWDSIKAAPTEALVNGLSMMSPFGAAEKQALLEAPDLKHRAQVLIAATEIELARTAPAPSSLQ